MATRRSLPSRLMIVHTPSRAVAREIIEPAGNDMQIFPPTVAVFQIFHDANRDRQHWLINGVAVQSLGPTRASSLTILQVEAISRPFSLTVSGSQPNPSRSMSLRRLGWSSENSQVPPASQASPSLHWITPV